ncbi:MAG: hypothetical protein AAFY88_11180 [Acidobacteriota bacterium]
MTAYALDLHDLLALVVAEGDAEPRAAVPAVARLDGDLLHLGDAAAAGARLLPRSVHSRFWDELSVEPLGSPFPAGWRVADLAHAHLGALWEAAGAPAEAAPLLIPGGLDEARLPLALGVAAAAGLGLGAVVHPAVAVGAAHWPDGAERAVYLELYRHRAVAAYLRRDADSATIAVERLAEDDRASAARLRSALVKATADAFVRTTRFDPLARAADEQQLHDRLPAWLDALERHGRVDARLGDGGRTASIELGHRELDAAADDVTRRLEALLDDSTPVLLGAHAAGALGVLRRLRARGVDVHALPADAACRGALAHRSQLLEIGPQVLTLRLQVP